MILRLDLITARFWEPGTRRINYLYFHKKVTGSTSFWMSPFPIPIFLYRRLFSFCALLSYVYLLLSCCYRLTSLELLLNLNQNFRPQV
ncbi:hypothetical protein K435DRAFT_52747 [Dendrothele bispora CBS 962.96]|uniref:Uncharacterized protein n=1 Tax=Dendrothele bispora (strain CBS 962.96) TaxID=1314807 RepID=A0A4S8M7M9_DENBC|nr:hypothetical protein K435DRAFT_52747 [Dendrothele bispora CBS 962.96]